MISTRQLAGLPDIDRLREVMQAMAVLDAIRQPEWEFRYYSFNARWAAGEMVGSTRSGSGDDLLAVFTDGGCFVKGFDHESAMSPYGQEPPRVWPGVLDVVPPEFAESLAEPAFMTAHTTFCVWRRYTDATWQVGPVEFPPGPDPDGSEFLLSRLADDPEAYRACAADPLGRDVDPTAVRHVFAHRPLTPDVVAALNPIVSLDDLEADLAEIGYPRRS